MYIPANKKDLEIVILKSRFIAICVPINKDIKDLLNEIKEEYPKASHYLYAYKMGNILKSNDDKEPGCIARNFLKLIELNKLDNILIVVVRYFGGTKLGASRLSSTYINLVNDLLKSIDRYEVLNFYKYTLEVDYKTFNIIKNIGLHIENIQYFDRIKVDIISKDNIEEKLLSLGVKNFKVESIKRSELCRA